MHHGDIAAAPLQGQGAQPCFQIRAEGRAQLVAQVFPCGGGGGGPGGGGQAKAGQGLQAAMAQPARPRLFGPVEKAQQHLFVIAHQAGDVIGMRHAQRL